MSVSKTFAARWLRRSCVALAVSGALAAAAVAVLPVYLERAAVGLAEHELGRRLTVERISVQPWRLAVQVRGLRLYEADGTTPAFDAAGLLLDLSAASLWQRAPVFDAVRLDAPAVHLRRARGSGAFNFADILARLAAAPVRATPSLFTLENVQIADGKIVFDDQTSGQHSELTGLQAMLPALSSLPQQAHDWAELKLSAHLDGAPLTLNGRLQPFAASPAGNFTLTLQGADLSRYRASLPAALRLHSGALTTRLDLNFRHSGAKPELLLAGNVQLDRLALHDQADAPLLKLAHMQLRLERLDLAGRSAVLGDVRLVQPELWLAPAAQPGSAEAAPVGTLTLHGLALEQARLHWRGAGALSAGLDLPQLACTRISVDGAARSVRIAGLELRGAQAQVQRGAAMPQPWQATPAAAAQPWQIALDSLAVRDADLDWRDQSVQPALALSARHVALSATHLSNTFATAATLDLSAELDGKGSLNLRATASPQLQTVGIDLDGRALPLARLAPYFAQHLNVAITRGTADARGRLDIAKAPGGAAGGAASASYRGRLALNDFHVLENGASEDFLEWKNIAAEGVSASFGAGAPRVEVAQLGLNDFFARVLLSEKGRLNLQNIAAQGGSATDKPAPQLRIGQIVLHGGNVDFSDHFIRPNYSARLTGLSGTVGTFATDRTEPASVELRGKIDDEAPLVISGSINPLRTPVFLDLKGSANGIELTPLTPYTSKYAGYPIKRGKLSVQVDYRIENGRLKANNALRLDQLTFGERVESPSATKLPVMLVLALLKDHNGQIAIDLPISGSLSDPQFSVRDVVWRTFGNLLQKAATAPFRLLGELFGHREELSSAAFTAGSAGLTPALRARLDQLADALRQRPGLQLDIGGRYDASADAPGLRQAVLEGRLHVLQQQNPGTPRAQLILTLWAQEHGATPALAAKTGAAAAEAALLQGIALRDEDLLDLAQRRADAVRDYLEDESKIARERLFLVAPGPADAAVPAGVGFALR